MATGLMGTLGQLGRCGKESERGGSCTGGTKKIMKQETENYEGLPCNKPNALGPAGEFIPTRMAR